MEKIIMVRKSISITKEQEEWLKNESSKTYLPEALLIRFAIDLFRKSKENIEKRGNNDDI